MIALALHGISAVLWFMALFFAVGLGIALEMKNRGEKGGEKVGMLTLYMAAMSAIAFTLQVMA